MGRAKSSLLLAGIPLIEHPIGAARAAGLEPWVIAKAGTPLPEVDCRIVIEPDEPAHVLAGLIAALDAAEGRAVLALGADMPFVDSKLIAWLASQPMTTVTEAAGRVQPLLARYGRSDAAHLRDALEAGEAATDAVLGLRPKIVPENDLARFGDPWKLSFNVNTPEDLVQAERVLTGTPA